MGDGPLWRLIILFILVMVNAFFASSEIAILSLNTNKLQKLSEDGDKLAAKLLKMSEDPSKFLSAIQIGITLAGFLASAYAAESFSDGLVSWVYEDIGFQALSRNTLDTLSLIFITLILTYFTLVLGELVPKRIAMQKPMSVAKVTVGVLSVISVIMKPIIWLLSVSTNGILILLRMNTKNEEEAVTEDEIRMMVDLGEEKGTIESAEKEMIENIFEFNNSTAADVMTHRIDIVALHIDDTPEVITETIRESGHSRYPVYDEDINDIIGILYAKEYLLEKDAGKTLRDLLHQAYCVPETVHSDALFRDMQKKKLHIAVVIDEYGATGGIVTMEDLLEEIVGNIYDEFDAPEDDEITLIGENTWKVSGSVDMETLAEILDIEIPDDLEYDTVGGLVFSKLITIPEDGTPIDIEEFGLKIHVDRLTDRRVEWAIIKKEAQPTVPADSE